MTPRQMCCALLARALYGEHDEVKFLRFYAAARTLT